MAQMGSYYMINFGSSLEIEIILEEVVKSLFHPKIPLLMYLKNG